jgi:hypothetical protein
VRKDDLPLDPLRETRTRAYARKHRAAHIRPDTAYARAVPALAPIAIERLSIELTNRCGKACSFCYNASAPKGETRWTADEVVGLVLDCAAHGTRAVSFGGGEPLEHPELFAILEATRGKIFRSMTTHGLLLTPAVLDRLAAVGVEKVHVSIHHPGHADEVARVANQVGALAARGTRSGVNLLVAASRLDDAARAADVLWSAGIDNDRIVYLPMRGSDTPSPEEVAIVAGRRPFQSMSCLGACGNSPRFAAVGWDKAVAWCSYTSARAPLASLDYRGLDRALAHLDVVFCGGKNERPLRLSRRAQHGHALVRGGP